MQCFSVYNMRTRKEKFVRTLAEAEEVYAEWVAEANALDGENAGLFALHQFTLRDDLPLEEMAVACLNQQDFASRVEVLRTNR